LCRLKKCRVPIDSCLPECYCARQGMAESGHSTDDEPDALDVVETSATDDRAVAAHLARRLAIVGEYRLHGDAQHIKRMREFTRLTATALGLPTDRVNDISEASQLHDIGMIAVPDSILLKPGKLTPEERTVVESHTTIGTRLMGRFPHDFLRTARAIILSHHEQWDGTGYPHKLAGTAIPIEARIVTIADAFDALQSARPHRHSVTPDMAITVMEQGGEGHFDPRVLKAFVANRDEIIDICERIPNR
jgi:putative two-component system response regulator